MANTLRSKLFGWLSVFGWLYITWLLFWLALHVLTGDRLWYVSLATSLAYHWFWPLPLLALVAVLARRRALWIGTAIVLIVWVALFGGLFNVRLARVRAANPALRAMTYNLAFDNVDIDAARTTIELADADIVALQELNPAMAAGLAPALQEAYPYQLLDAQWGVTGMGLVSRYPLEALPVDTLGTTWIGAPQAAEITTPRGLAVVLNVHFAHGPARDRNAERVAAWAAAQELPIVVIGDLNATDLSDAHKALTRAGLHDTWREVGWGYGSTFPAAGGLVVNGRLIPVPGPLVRIDYILHSDGVRALSIERLPWDGNSDHFAVVAELALSDN